MEVLCSHCGQLCWVPEQEAGNELVCPLCDKTFVAVAAEPGLLQEATDILTRELPVVFGPAVRKATYPAKARYRAKRRLLRAVVLLATAGVLLTGGAWLVGRLSGWARSATERSAGYAAETTHANEIVDFQPDPEFAVQLTYTRAVEQFALDLPPNYILFNVLSDPAWLPRDANFVGAEFRGPPGTRALMYCWIVTFDGHSTAPGSLEKALDRFYTWLAYNASLLKVTHTPGEIGRLGGRFCIRSEFSGSYRAHGKTSSESRVGTVYILVDGNRQVCLYTFCVPEEGESRRLLEAALLTWREKEK